MDQELWLQLARKAEASVYRYRNRLPPWLDLDDLKQEIVSRIPRFLKGKSRGVNSRKMELGYYIYCRASFEVRRILSRPRQPDAPIEDIELAHDHHAFDLVDGKEELRKELDYLSPTEHRVLMMHYGGRKSRTIARYLGRTTQWVEQTLAKIKYDLLITGEEPRVPDTFAPRRMAA